MARLILIPTPLGDVEHQILPDYALQIVRKLDVFIVERGKTARKFLKEMQTAVPFKEMVFYELNKRTDISELPSFLEAINEGKDIGLMSEAGCPGVADPGAQIVDLAHQKGIEVLPLIGPSSILMALMASGMNGQSFAFNGYLPIKPNDLKRELQRLEKKAIHENQSQILIETPYRNKAFIEGALKYLHATTRLTIACNISLPDQFIRTLTISNWKKEKMPDLHKKPTVFIIGK